jgi:hypothetical protein
MGDRLCGAGRRRGPHEHSACVQAHCFLPLVGLIAVFLPNLKPRGASQSRPYPFLPTVASTVPQSMRFCAMTEKPACQNRRLSSSRV